MKIVLRPRKTLLPNFATALASALMLVTAGVNADTVTVYSARNEQLIKPLFDAYTKETGAQIQLLTDKEGPLLERLKAEGPKARLMCLLRLMPVTSGMLGWLRFVCGPLSRQY